MPTTLKLPTKLERRIRAAARAGGMSPHAFMIAALERETRRAEQRSGFVTDALKRRADIARTGTGYEADKVHAQLKARAAGRRTTRSINRVLKSAPRALDPVLARIQSKSLGADEGSFPDWVGATTARRPRKKQRG